MLHPSVREALDAVMASVDALAAAVARQSAAGAGASAGAGGSRGCDATAVAGLQALALVATASHARQTRLLVEAAGETPETLTARLPHDPDRDTRISDVRAIELAATMNCTPNRARSMVHEARVLVLQMPLVLEAVGEGRVTPYQARLAVDGWQDLAARFDGAGAEVDDKVRAKFQERILSRAHLQTATEFKRTVGAAVALLAPSDITVARQRARDERCVTVQPAGNGMAYLTAYLEAAQAARIMQVLTHAARTDTTLTGTQAQRMADALVGIVAGNTELSATARANAAEIQVLVTFEAMAQVAQALAAGQVPECGLVGEIVGSDTIVEGQSLLELMRDARFRRLIIDDATGQLLDYGRETYRPPAALRDHVQGRDRMCRAPGCIRPARYADVDHVRPWESGGTTAADNLAALCRTHHVLKTHGSWSYAIDASGAAVWQTPGGFSLSRAAGTYADLIPVGASPPDDPPPF